MGRLQISAITLCGVHVMLRLCLSMGATPVMPLAPGKIGTCEDTSNFCTYGHSQGYCKSTVSHVVSFMKTHCRKACGFCEDQASTNCLDSSLYCSYGKSIGECASKETYINSFMHQNCRKSCGFCKEQQVVCKDEHTQSTCAKYSSMGYCDNLQFRNYFLKYCKKTCNFCDITKTYSCGIAKAQDKSYINQIVGGETAAKGNWPWQVAILHKGSFKCGGTLINTHYVISAAHCFRSSTQAEEFTIVLGEHHRQVHEGTEQTVGVKKITVHPNYQPKVSDDIAIIELAQKAILTKYITPACLPDAGQEVDAGTKCFMSGWGRTSAGGAATQILQEAPLKIISLSDCQARSRKFVRKVTSSMICGGDDVNIFASGCHGDSGGPLVCKSSAGRLVLQGVVSWGSPVCDALDHYTVFTKVSMYKNWIDSAMHV